MKIIKRIILFILLILILTGLLAVYAVKIEPYRLAVRDYDLKNGAASAELKLVHISDIQVSEAYSEERLGKLVDKINGQSPDIVVFTGDLYDNYAAYHPEKKVEKALSAIEARYGKYAVWGNRDYGGGAMRLIRESYKTEDLSCSPMHLRPSASPTEKRLESAGWMTYCSEHQTMN